MAITTNFYTRLLVIQGVGGWWRCDGDRRLGGHFAMRLQLTVEHEMTTENSFRVRLGIVRSSVAPYHGFDAMNKRVIV